MNQALREQDLVLLGGGHSHALALLMLAMKAPAETRLTLVSPESFTPYSGMLPGLISGHYSFADTHIDLGQLCDRLGVRFVRAAATGIDYQARTVLFEQRPPLSFDVLSVDIGAQPGWSDVSGAREHATAVKPVAGFYQRWLQVRDRIAALPQGQRFQVVVVGGGAGSVEIALAMRHCIDNRDVEIRLLASGSLLREYNSRARAAVYQACQRSGIAVTEQERVTQVDAAMLHTSAGASYGFDALFWCTGAVAAPWLTQSGLPCTSDGFLRVLNSLQVEDHPQLFAAGDVATQTDHPRPKAGVFAVRQAPVLAHNLLASLQEKPLRNYRPQQRFLSLLALGERSAVADRSWLSVSGSWVWRWKDHIDRSFMQRFSAAKPIMPKPSAAADAPMHCGGCGAKLPAALLRGALGELAARYPQAVAVEQLREDAALLEVPTGARIFQSVDILRELVADPWLMGRIAALHALSDLYAMAAQPHSALCSLTLPYAGPAIQQRDLSQLLSGVLFELEAADCRLLGGHTLEGPELNLGLTVNGLDTGQLLPKQGLAPGDQLVLCKALGTGALFAAQQQGVADGRWIEQALDSMLLSNRGAALIASEHAVTAATDITGFGLAGHLLEMLPESGSPALQMRLDIASLPLLEGLKQVFNAGITSTLQPGNLAGCAASIAPELLVDTRPEALALFDPQTSGGLLLAVKSEAVEQLLVALRGAGYTAVCRIGEIAEAGPAGPFLVAE
ncbi:selenide, water dikinase SelD [Halieaceae bacterium IMCC14734]|uniref:Selenide, water dikinase SelD n=1 Tax=Candidatus Litorirhabdus singularis TaxID=2518993 RepID=A0ABT3TC47_9GAMM|nr:selenide, water dikinase SelD [Candidatus Litorirhabdus singularis]MCX2979866.1 selenide, water dikinase SelD [Candidatus Litorirhabdus singularis]